MHRDTIDYFHACIKYNQFKTNKQVRNGLLIPEEMTILLSLRRTAAYSPENLEIIDILQMIYRKGFKK